MAPKLTPDQARQGEKTNRMRYVLGVSLGAAVVVLMMMLLVWT